MGLGRLYSRQATEESPLIFAIPTKPELTQFICNQTAANMLGSQTMTLLKTEHGIYSWENDRFSISQVQHHINNCKWLRKYD